MMKLPLMSFNIGAPAERIRNYEQGYIIKDVTATSILEKVKSLYLVKPLLPNTAEL